MNVKCMEMKKATNAALNVFTMEHFALLHQL
jgi:hypothetical protein